MKFKLNIDITENNLISGDIGYGVISTTENGPAYNVLFPANDRHQIPVMLVFYVVDNSIAVTDDSSNGEDVYYKN
ncbi:TPA: hypothetical protein ACNGY8_002181 [Klebsiella michiganensis]|uniref:hypothetical protein n=1 Tax=Klebsiella michiganensis TaxID=1134687 RepID=UPI0015E9F35D|nr:hypothetical protein [Klebsiella michiganensis]QMR54343.1 hypothetical protein HV264_05025 [Klebsiella michiganensis]